MLPYMHQDVVTGKVLHLSMKAFSNIQCEPLSIHHSMQKEGWEIYFLLVCIQIYATFLCSFVVDNLSLQAVYNNTVFLHCNTTEQQCK